MDEKTNISWNDFQKLDIRVGTIFSVKIFKEAKKPAFQLSVDFGSLGIKKTSAQITKLYSPDNLVGKQVVAVVNLPKKQIANYMSECLILGVVDDNNTVVLLEPERKIKNGLPIG